MVYYNTEKLGNTDYLIIKLFDTFMHFENELIFKKNQTFNFKNTFV